MAEHNESQWRKQSAVTKYNLGDHVKLVGDGLSWWKRNRPTEPTDGIITNSNDGSEDGTQPSYEVTFRFMPNGITPITKDWFDEDQLAGMVNYINSPYDTESTEEIREMMRGAKQIIAGDASDFIERMEEEGWNRRQQRNFELTGLTPQQRRNQMAVQEETMPQPGEFIIVTAPSGYEFPAKMIGHSYEPYTGTGAYRVWYERDDDDGEGPYTTDTLLTKGWEIRPANPMRNPFDPDDPEQMQEMVRNAKKGSCRIAKKFEGYNPTDDPLIGYEDEDQFKTIRAVMNSGPVAWHLAAYDPQKAEQRKQSILKQLAPQKWWKQQYDPRETQGNDVVRLTEEITTPRDFLLGKLTDRLAGRFVIFEPGSLWKLNAESNLYEPVSDVYLRDDEGNKAKLSVDEAQSIGMWPNTLHHKLNQSPVVKRAEPYIGADADKTNIERLAALLDMLPADGAPAYAWVARRMQANDDAFKNNNLLTVAGAIKRAAPYIEWQRRFGNKDFKDGLFDFDGNESFNALMKWSNTLEDMGLDPEQNKIPWEDDEQKVWEDKKGNYVVLLDPDDTSTVNRHGEILGHCYSASGGFGDQYHKNYMQMLNDKGIAFGLRDRSGRPLATAFAGARGRDEQHPLGQELVVLENRSGGYGRGQQPLDPTGRNPKNPVASLFDQFFDFLESKGIKVEREQENKSGEPYRHPEFGVEDLEGECEEYDYEYTDHPDGSFNIYEYQDLINYFNTNEHDFSADEDPYHYDDYPDCVAYTYRGLPINVQLSEPLADSVDQWADDGTFYGAEITDLLAIALAVAHLHDENGRYAGNAASELLNEAQAAKDAIAAGSEYADQLERLAWCLERLSGAALYAADQNEFYDTDYELGHTIVHLKNEFARALRLDPADVNKVYMRTPALQGIPFAARPTESPHHFTLHPLEGQDYTPEQLQTAQSLQSVHPIQTTPPPSFQVGEDISYGGEKWTVTSVFQSWGNQWFYNLRSIDDPATTRERIAEHWMRKAYTSAWKTSITAVPDNSLQPERDEEDPEWNLMHRRRKRKHFPYKDDAWAPAQQVWANVVDHQAVMDQNAGRNLQGLPVDPVNVRGIGPLTFGAHGGIQEVAENYNMDQGLGEHPTSYVQVNPENAKFIAAEYERMQHNPNDPKVKAAYDALKREALAQYKHAIEAGYTFDFFPEGEDPYANSPREAVLDLHNNKHMYVFPTVGEDGGFGQDAEEHPGHPLLEFVPGLEWSGKPVTYNDVFRAIHDFYGHAKEGLGFRHDGEDNAFRQHAAMFSPLARRALTTETRGQNSWVNFGPYGEHNQTATHDTIYAPQKAGLLPEWVSDIDLHANPANATIPTRQMQSSNKPDVAAVLLSDDPQSVMSVSREEVREALDVFMADDKPWEHFEKMFDNGALKLVAPALAVCKDYNHHPNKPERRSPIYKHMLAVLEEMCELTDDIDLRWTALLHDIGKPKAQWIDEDGDDHYYKQGDQGEDHELAGAALAAVTLKTLKFDADRAERICQLIKHHMFFPFTTEHGAEEFVKWLNTDGVDPHEQLMLRRADMRGKVKSRDLDDDFDEAVIDLQDKLVKQHSTSSWKRAVRV